MMKKQFYYIIVIMLKNMLVRSKDVKIIFGIAQAIHDIYQTWKLLMLKKHAQLNSKS